MLAAGHFYQPGVWSCHCCPSPPTPCCPTPRPQPPAPLHQPHLAQGSWPNSTAPTCSAHLYHPPVCPTTAIPKLQELQLANVHQNSSPCMSPSPVLHGGEEQGSTVHPLLCTTLLHRQLASCPPALHFSKKKAPLLGSPPGLPPSCHAARVPSRGCTPKPFACPSCQQQGSGPLCGLI